MLPDVKDLLLRAMAKSNDSSEEKHVSEFLSDILADQETGDQAKLELVRASAQQMKDFCDLVVEAANKPVYR